MLDKTKASEILTQALALIEGPKKIARGRYAERADGYSADFMSQDAFCFCLMGALNRVCNTIENRFGSKRYDWPSGVSRAMIHASNANGYAGYTDLNDFGGYDKVVDTFKKAIQFAKEEEECERAKSSSQPES